MLGLGIDEPLLNIDDDETGWLSERVFRRRTRIISNWDLHRQGFHGKCFRSTRLRAARTSSLRCFPTRRLGDLRVDHLAVSTYRRRFVRRICARVGCGARLWRCAQRDGRVRRDQVVGAGRVRLPSAVQQLHATARSRAIMSRASVRRASNLAFVVSSEAISSATRASKATSASSRSVKNIAGGILRQ